MSAKAKTTMKKDTHKKAPAAMWTPLQYAEFWGVSRMTVYRALNDGRIDGAVRLHKQWRIPADALMK